MREYGCVTFSATLVLVAVSAARGDDVDFTRDVRPILARHCFKCHGPDDKARKGELRLDLRDEALKGGSSGERAIVPGKSDESELVRRIFSDDETEAMPPAAAKLPLTAEEKETLKAWIAGGANYVPHWAFVAPKQAPLPKVKHANWPRNRIDDFVLARMEENELAPAPAADKFTLVRRLYLDLIGMPPTVEEADAFVNDRAADAYEQLVDRLLKSPHYGERWGRKWLDLARYADTNGYEKDRARVIWPYRDWVIQALNDDMPFDRFTIEQIAGDLLPDAAVEQRIATGFHRNTMLNEEGGIDPLEFRFYAMTDRVATTGTAWLGLTLGCCQCHTHKYDPISHREYYQFMAFMNNADEPVMDVPQPAVVAARAAAEKKIREAIDDLPNRFPLEGDFRWQTVTPTNVVSAGGAMVNKLEDGSVRLSGTNPEKDTYRIELDSDLPKVDAIRLEALADPQLPSNGPGRTPHGNFVLTELTVAAGPRDGSAPAKPVKLAGAVADFSQDGFPVSNAIDGQPTTGWAIHGPGNWNIHRTATFQFDHTVSGKGPLRWTIGLDQQHGMQHTLGKFRISLGVRNDDPRPESVRRRDHLDRKLAAWIERETERLVKWTVLRPVAARANLPILTILDDDSILASSDQTKRDVYDLEFKTDLRGVTAIRVEAIPDDRLPGRGSGRVYYEGPIGDFYLSNITLTANGRRAQFARASQTFADGKNTAATAIDDDQQSGWSVNGGQFEPQIAVFNLAEPLTALPASQGGEFDLQMVFEKYYACGLGRFRISATNDTRPVEASSVPHAIEEILLVPAESRSANDRERLLRHFVRVAPELAAENAAIKKLRDDMPRYLTTLVMAERPATEVRTTYLHKRGEFLQPQEPVDPGIPRVLPQIPAEAARNRLTFARWLVDPANPLTARVVMNRTWGTLFGRGIVTTTEDFGFQGAAPTHPGLLDWLAVEFIKQGWSMKKMHRLIVTSATYRQSSSVNSEVRARDPQNRWLARGPRFRIEGELVRDTILRISGLLSSKIGGPSVFPPQPPGVTSEGTYGGLPWTVSTGPDRYRRGMYTFSKRTAPYAMFNTFDTPSGEACVARREVSNTPLQALTLMNDAVFVEAAQKLGTDLAALPGTTDERLTNLFRRCLVRPPTADELRLLNAFLTRQQARLASQEVDAAKVAGSAEGNVAERAVWTVLARALLNLDETITRD